MGTQFYRGFVVIPTDLILRSKYLWVRLWAYVYNFNVGTLTKSQFRR
ncbi:hypothetical protein LEP1GSC021_0909 [Leptospira noguchii str. 1993005606]|uniref:Uncharacterized protein n=2 Tax=Leptospira noguchii TaxID=28182 RepID=M6YJ55_9LEPT|nr:hypothetical protein LEP1GSC035_3751 [Leptospira noguchii str. 2007001578]EMO89639.1 hypothetical protein LEP1GSC024_2711 [Leptospira noguchii str. 2001034031]EPE82715.1 hypothetical protein LEP1GSC021_0909 [Leptospira noguchii str. 1993005606]